MADLFSSRSEAFKSTTSPARPKPKKRVCLADGAKEENAREFGGGDSPLARGDKTELSGRKTYLPTQIQDVPTGNLEDQSPRLGVDGVVVVLGLTDDTHLPILTNGLHNGFILIVREGEGGQKSPAGRKDATQLR